MCTSPSGVYLAGKLQWHFACGFNFGHSLRLTFVTTFVVLKRLGIALSGLGGRVGCVQDQGLSVCVPRLLGFILLMGFSGALLVSVLDMVWIAICGCFCGPGAPGWPFPGWGGGGLVGYVQNRDLGAHEPCLPRFILLVSFSDTLLVASILDIVLRCYLCGCFCSPEKVKAIYCFTTSSSNISFQLF